MSSGIDDSRGIASSGLKEINEIVETSFHDVLYIVSVSTIRNESLVIEVEEKSTASKWRGDFTAGYIEDITSKTGNFKKFAVFSKMLLSAIKKNSDSVFVDLLTYQDLELLKSRKHGTQTPTPTRNLASQNKRYMILTYAAEFDRVHYPLPLLFEENPDPARLKEIIAKLRSEIANMQSEVGGKKSVEGLSELRHLREENHLLKQQLKHLERQTAEKVEQDGSALDGRTMARELKLVTKERDALFAKISDIEADLERESSQHRRELRRNAKELQETQDELSSCHELIRELRAKIKQLTEALEGNGRQFSASDKLKSVYTRSTSRGSQPSSRPSYRSDRRSALPSIPPPPQRNTSRGRENSSRERTRPISAPARERFDPTAYVRQRKEREVSRRPGPPSQTSSGRSTPPSYSRNTSAERSRHGGSATSSRPSSNGRAAALTVPPPNRRPPTPDRNSRPMNGRETSSERSRHTGDSYGRNIRSGSPSSSTGPPRVARQAWSPETRNHTSSSSKPVAGTGGWSKFPGPNSSAERSSSPGRALTEVKKKLNDYVAHRTNLTEDIVEPSMSTASPRSAVYDDANAEIADIDARLHALQNFLKMAKTSGSSLAGS